MEGSPAFVQHYRAAREMVEKLEHKEVPLAPLSPETAATVALTHAVLALTDHVSEIRLAVERYAAGA